MTGRPSKYDSAIAAEICERLMGGESLRTICKDDHMPAASTVFRWLRVEPGFSEQYAHAREVQADLLFDDVLDIADDGRNDWMMRLGDDGTAAYTVNGEHIQRSKLRVDSRKWMAGKLAPKKYGEKVSMEHTGKNGAPIEIEDKTPRDLGRMIAFALALGAKE
jgi:hypothetical protein